MIYGLLNALGKPLRRSVCGLYLFCLDLPVQIKKMAIYETILLIALLTGFTEAEMTLIDLTHNFDNTTTIYWPTTRQDRFKLLNYQTTDDGSLYYESNTFSAAEHGGTHIDAPRHFVKGKQGVNEIPLSNLVGTAYIADFTKESNASADFQIEEKHLITYEEKHGKIKDGDILILYTGTSYLFVYSFIKSPSDL